MRIYRKFFAAALLLAATSGALFLWAGNAAPHGNIDQALKTDITNFDDQQLLKFVTALNLDGSTAKQRLDLITRIKARFDALSLTQRLSLLLASRDIFKQNPDSTLVTNGSALMQAYWDREVGTYMKASAEERQKMLDARIDESLTYENLQKIQDAAKSLVGIKPDVHDIHEVQTQVLHAIVDSMKNGSADERAGATQFFLDMRQRRLDRGLSVQF